MIKWIRDNRNSIIRNSFLLPILLVVIMSISHVVSWYDIGNPYSWAIYLSVAIEIFALASVSASSIKMKRGSIWFLFGLVTLIQITGNIFYEFRDINPTGENFLSWIELIRPMFEDWDVLDHRRFLATIQGGTLPIMSLTALHFYIKFSDLKDDKIEDTPIEPTNDDIIKNAKDLELKKVFEKAKEMGNARKDSMTYEEYQQMIDDEPSALAFTSYNIDEELEKSMDKAAEIDAKIDEELKKAAEPEVIKPEDPHTKAGIDEELNYSRGTTPIYSKMIDPRTGKFTHKIIKPHGDT